MTGQEYKPDRLDRIIAFPLVAIVGPGPKEFSRAERLLYPLNIFFPFFVLLWHARLMVRAYRGRLSPLDKVYLYGEGNDE